jgi:hypothetical protein
MNYINVIKLTDTGKYLLKIRCKWKDKVSGALTPLRVTRE